ncbi:MAG: (Fe-S)-binding protein [Thermodesulfobacteriota bacterium]|nr:(Fe-S)-binding protein [Thermodesulfobacteriota bacterium]
MEYADMIHRCFRCGWCKLPVNFHDINCPSYLKYRFETFSSGGRLWLIRAWLQNEIEASDRFSEILFSCVTCKNCVQACALPEIKDYLVDMVIAAREEMVEKGVLPPPVRDFLKAITTSGNPYKRLQTERGKWADGLDIENYKDQEYLFYVGDAGSYDEIGQKMARSVASLLSFAGVSFGILAERETGDGNDVKAIGEKELFLLLAAQNINKFRDFGIKKVITLSPHGFNSIKNEYPKCGGDFEVYHYTQVLSGLVKDTLSLSPLNVKVTYHDPCYLGRWNNEYTAPRDILQSIPGLDLIEMDRCRENSLCCGGGGGNFFTDILGPGKDSSSRVRVREAFETGAEILAVSCPICAKMFDDAIKAEELEEKIQVKDVAEIVYEARK